MQAWKSPSESEQNVLGHFVETGRAPPDRVGGSLGSTRSKLPHTGDVCPF